MTIVHKGDIGTIFRVSIEEDGEPVNVSSATVTKEIVFRKPDGTGVTKAAQFYTDGSDSFIQYATVAGDLDQPGIWEIQGYVAITGWTGHGSKQSFEVLDTLRTT